MKQVSFVVLFVLLVCALSIGFASATCAGKNYGNGAQGVENGNNAGGGDEGEDVDTLVAPFIAAAGRELMQEGYKYAKKKGWDKKLRREVEKRLKKGAKKGLRKVKNLFKKKKGRKGHKKRGGHKKRRHSGGARSQAYVATVQPKSNKCYRCKRTCGKLPRQTRRFCYYRCKQYCK